MTWPCDCAVTQRAASSSVAAYSLPSVLGQVPGHEPLAVLVAQDAALAADGLGDEQALHARRPDHSGRVELHELHVDQLGARLEREGVPIAAVLPRVRGDRVGLADAAGGQDHRLRREEHGGAGRPPIAERAGDAGLAGDDPGDRALHEHVDARRDGAILEGPDHLQPRAIADVGESRVGVATERALEDAPVAGAVEDRAPQLQLAHPVGRLHRVQLGHARVVQELAADHRVPEVGLPLVLRVDVPERRRDAALGHHGVGLAQERLAHEADRRPGCLGLDRCPEPGAAGADDEDVDGVRLDLVERLRSQHERPIPRLEVDGEVANDPRRQQARVDIGEGDRDQARPGPPHVVPIQISQPLPEGVPDAARPSAGEAVDPAAHQVAQGVARERVAGQEHHVHQEQDTDGADAEARVGDVRVGNDVERRQDVDPQERAAG